MGSSFLTVEDFRRRARRRLPKVAFDFVDGAAESETTMHANLRAFTEVNLRPKNGTRVGTPDLSTTVLGEQLSPARHLKLVENRGVHEGGQAPTGLGKTFFGLMQHGLFE